MVILPIVERELRTASHQPRTWWRRGLAGGIGIVIMGFMYLDAYRWADAPRIGQALFEGLAGFSFVFAVCAGPMATSDCLSSEKRNGTLGLLFLTDLRSLDVVLGKLFASSLSLCFAFVTLLPLVALPLIMGGVSGSQLALMLLALLCTFFLSLATGLLASSLCTGSRAGLVLNAAIMGVLTIGIPLVASGIFHFKANGPRGWLVFMLCPQLLVNHAFGSFSRMAAWRFWLNVGAILAFSCACVGLACWQTARAWQDRPAGMGKLRWRERLQRWSAGARAARVRYRHRALERNPLFWLDDRYRWQKDLMWLALGLVAAIYLEGWLYHRNWVASYDIILWGLFINYSLCLWVILQATHRFCQDRESGAFELLLVTPLSTAEMIRGRMQALRSQFGLAILFAVVGGLLVWRNLVLHHPGRDRALFIACLFGLGLLPLQAWMLARVGLYLSLRHKSSLTAALGAVWRVVLIPWLLFMLLVMVYDTLRRWQIISFNEDIFFVTWFLLQVLAGLGFTAIANYQLHCNFRVLATQPAKVPWWWRILKV